MNGVTEVQLTLQGRAREQDDRRPHTAIEVKSSAATPAGMSRWALYRHRITSRRALLELTDAELRDIGLDFRQARIEAMKPFWRD
ncbi:DUF1127 domain-containing protein [Pseudomonas sp. v388]|uniref:DUF1127 domain-containing protein n=1 Tax=Pseudomonas sp. v388 TaxID=2479849 RepID=UPI000F78B586|nr:DUF1127 domain-containing protein [Pseudomonas sp. v388]RRV09141.1 DUF1127 domain-containing protein [Pseudomonas sp. v388]